VSFERLPRRWERQFVDLLGLAMPLGPDEAQRSFGDSLEVERLAEVTHESKPLPGMSGYLMTRNQI
jgi:hypothetical protein